MTALRSPQIAIYREQCGHVVGCETLYTVGDLCRAVRYCHRQWLAMDLEPLQVGRDSGAYRSREESTADGD